VSLRQAQKELTRSRLVDAAGEMFRAKGYAATTIDDVVSAAGATRATFYLHFGGKVDLIAEIHKRIEPELERVNEELTAAIRDGQRAAIARWLDSAFRLWESLKDVASAQQEAAASEPQIRAAMTASYDRAIAAIVEGFRQAGRWNSGQRKVRAILMYSQLQNVFHRWMRVGWDVNRAEMLRVMTDMWLAAAGA
jgi:AcrR family transcriptional regulator